MNLPGKGQNSELGSLDTIGEGHPFHHSSHETSSHRAFGNDLIGNTGDLKQRDPISSSTSTSAADTLSMLTQSMLGTMPSAVATAAAAGLFMRVSGGGNGASDGTNQGKYAAKIYIV